jgi:hypothetical protein
MLRKIIIFFIALLTLMLAACSSAGTPVAPPESVTDANLTPSETYTPWPTSTATYTPAPTVTSLPTFTAVITITPAPTQTPLATRPPTFIVSEAEDGWQQYTDTVTGYTISLPEAWYGFDYSPESIDTAVAAMREAGVNEETIASIETLKENSTVVLEMMALEATAGSSPVDGAANVNIVSDTQSRDVPMETFVERAEAQLTLLLPDIEILDSGTYELPNDESAGYLEYVTTAPASSGQTVEVHGLQLYLQTDRAKIVLTITALQRNFQRDYADIFDQIRESFLPVE